MKHYGDIKELDGAKLPVVDVITGGSPCQDLSLAGSRQGLDGDRSGLFFEQMRIVKEMREHDRAVGRTGYLTRPRYMVWENVPGTFSSNKGKDFQAVLSEIVRIVTECPDVPIPKGGWKRSGCLMGHGEDGCPFSIAWRVHDAQFWGTTQYVDGRMLFPGTPQRRRRIALVADFGGLSAPEILFERKGLRGYPAEIEGEEQTPAAGIGTGSERADKREGNESNGDDFFFGESRKARGGKGVLVTSEKVGSLSTCDIHRVLRGGYYPIEHHPSDSREKLNEEGIVQTLNERMGTGGCNVPLVLKTDDI